MKKNAKLAALQKLVLTSPYFLPVFLAIPLYVVVRFKQGLPFSGDLLLGNNVAFLLLILARLVRYLRLWRQEIRYGADCGVPQGARAVDRPLPELREELAAGGFRFDAGGRYGEKRDAGFAGTTVLYGGMLLLLLFGSYDYLREYSIMVRIGVGEPMSLDGKGLTGQFEAGNLAATASLPLLQVREQQLPNAQWPQGATRIALLDKDRRELASGVIAPGKPFRYRGLDYHMTRFVYDTMIVIRQGNMILYEKFVKLLPLPAKNGEYGYYGGLGGRDAGKVKGGAWLNAEKRAVLVDAALDGKKLGQSRLELWGQSKRDLGDYQFSLEGMAQWSEIRVARSRHRAMLAIGAVLALLGALTRLACRPQRVWLEEAGSGSRLKASGGKAARLLRLER